MYKYNCCLTVLYFRNDKSKLNVGDSLTELAF